jgi:hypothetical protein
MDGHICVVFDNMLLKKEYDSLRPLKVFCLKYRVFQKELYYFERVYKFMKRTYPTFSTVMM